MKLCEKWHKAVEQKGEYIVQESSWWKWKMCLLFLLKKLKALFGLPNILRVTSNLQGNPTSRYYYHSHFTDGETEARKE